MSSDEEIAWQRERHADNVVLARAVFSTIATHRVDSGCSHCNNAVESIAVALDAAEDRGAAGAASVPPSR